MDKIVSLCKRRGFVFQSSEIYGGLGSCWDYGPLGVLLKNNVKQAWWKSVVQERRDMVGQDSAILMHPRTWEASGHIATFHDPLVDDKKTNERFRADHFLAEVVAEGRAGNMPKTVKGGNKEFLDELIRTVEALTIEGLLKDKEKTEWAFGGLQGASGGELTQPRNFNLMFKTFMGPVEDTAAVIYMRPETAQGIFVNFKNVVNATRRKPPFGIAQIGKSFRNEITPGNFTFRTREFEQMEIEYFCPPDQAPKFFDEWGEARWNWYLNLGIDADKLRRRFQEAAELAHYSAACCDIEYRFPFGWSELEGCANRTDYDLKQHAEFSGKDLTFFDEESKTHYTPYVIEPSAGADRATLAFLVDAYHEEDLGKDGKEDIRVVLRLHHSLAPYQVAVLPLSRKPELGGPAQQILDRLSRKWRVDYDETASIGKRYRRQDEIGTPFCLTVDFDSLNDKQVTIRERDSMSQVRLPISEVEAWLTERLGPKAADLTESDVFG
ncbi:MAG: glycine--tRNA ligase [Candidatus Sericytochromatia bacterium]|nr:glycine--tRNA ligase [Candidatus Sericytochromatia bacterium]